MIRRILAFMYGTGICENCIAGVHSKCLGNCLCKKCAG